MGSLSHLLFLCYSKDRCHLSHEFVNINSLSSVRTGNLSPNRGFFQNTADFFNGKTVALRNACISLSGKELEKGDVAFKLNLFPFLPIIIRFWEADDEFPASLQILADRNTLDYMHYETLMFALTHLFSRLKEEMRIEKGWRIQTTPDRVCCWIILEKWVFCYWNQRNSQTNRPSKMIFLFLFQKQGWPGNSGNGILSTNLAGTISK